MLEYLAGPAAGAAYTHDMGVHDSWGRPPFPGRFLAKTIVPPEISAPGRDTWTLANLAGAAAGARAGPELSQAVQLTRCPPLPASKRKREMSCQP